MTRILLVLILIVFNSTIYAQSKTNQIKGEVLDTQLQGIGSATISLLRSKDSSLVKITLSDKSGKYLFEVNRTGRYLLSFTAVGFGKAYSETFELSDANPEISLSAMKLPTQAKNLKEVSVVASRPLVEQKVDRMVINVEAAITNAGLNALEVLEKSPGIQVDKDGNISLKGKQGVMILIDGRQSFLSGQDLANMLRTMNANQLDQVEIMTNPPAKYDAEGNSGIINIKTKKNKQFGYNGSVSLQYTQGRLPKFNESVTFNYRKNKVNLFTVLGHNYNTNFGQLDIKRYFRDRTSKDLLSYFEQEARMRNEFRSYNLKLGMDYFVNKKTTLGFVVTGFLNSQESANKNSTNISDQNGVIVNQTRATSTNNQKWKNFSTNINYRKILDTSGKELTADLDYIGYNSRNQPILINSYFDGDGNPTITPDTLLGGLPQDIKIFSGKADYLFPFKKGGRFEAGVKSSVVRTDNDAVYDSIVNGQLKHDFNRSNHFVYEENINAIYASLNKPINKKWGGQLGLRVENTNAKGDQLTTGEQFNRHYTQLFPTAYLQYTHNKKNSFTLNYGRRIRRPDYQSLNPFINFLDRYTYQQGNPNLKPQFSHNMELIHTFKSIFITTLNYTRTTDIIQSVIEQNEEKNETYVRRANIANQRQFGLSVNASNQFAKWWRSNIYVNVFNNKFEGIVNNSQVSVNATTFTMNGSQQFTITKTLSAEISGFYRSGAVEGVIFAKSMGAVSFGMSKQIMKSNGTLRLNVRDIFYSQQFRGVSKYGNVDATFRESRDSRAVTLGFSYRFTKGKMNGNNPKRRSGSATDEQSRIGG